MTPSNGWSEYEKLVLAKLESHDDAFSEVFDELKANSRNLLEFKLEVSKSINNQTISFGKDIADIKSSVANVSNMEKTVGEQGKEIGNLKVNVGQLDVKSGLWGSLGGIVAIVFLFLSVWLKGSLAQTIQSLF